MVMHPEVVEGHLQNSNFVVQQCATKSEKLMLVGQYLFFSETLVVI
jgi:hypothetical protein